MCRKLQIILPADALAGKLHEAGRSNYLELQGVQWWWRWQSITGGHSQAFFECFNPRVPTRVLGPEGGGIIHTFLNEL